MFGLVFWFEEAPETGRDERLNLVLLLDMAGLRRPFVPLDLIFLYNSWLRPNRACEASSEKKSFYVL